MGISLRLNENLIKYSDIKNILSEELKSLNAFEQKNMINITNKILQKDGKTQKYNKTNDKYILYLNSNKKSKSNYKIQKENISHHNFIGIEIMKYFIINILLCRFYIINSLINFKMNKIYNNNIKFYSYEISLKVKGIGIKNILSQSFSHLISCPLNIYLNNTLVTKELEDCHYIDITEPNIEIKLEWNNITINSTRGMFYNCTEITEINMTQFDTSLVTDMSEMFSMCSSLYSVDVSNLDTTKVETFENMFYNCISLTSLNLESFTNPSATSLSRMFYGCENLEYINIKNFEEIKNINLDKMFHNIPKNVVVCLSSCPPPTYFTINSMTEEQATISWEGYEFNKFIISYGLQNLSNPEEGEKIWVINKTNYTLTNLSLYQRYDVYIKTDCGSKSSYWIGPLLISIESYNMTHTGTNSITTCSKFIYVSGGPKGNYKDNANSILIIKPEDIGKLITIKGKINTESNYDYLYIYNGEGTKGKLFGRYHGIQTIPLFISTTGSLTIKFTTDHSQVRSGLELFASCMINTQTIYNILKSNNCSMISCDSDYKNIKNIILPNSGLCLKNCNSTNQKFHYKGKCYNNCPSNSINNNFMCYSKSIIDKCELYSIESNYEDLCIKCKIIIFLN